MGKQHAAVSSIPVEWDDVKHPKVNVKDGPLNKALKLKSAKGDDEFTPSRIVADLKLDLGDANCEICRSGRCPHQDRLHHRHLSRP